MHRIVIGITSLEQHHLTLSCNPEVYRPAACPHCGFGVLWSHGSYDRKADRIGAGRQSANPVPIPRYCCAGCGGTCSRLPACIAPRRWYHWLIQQLHLRALLRQERVDSPGTWPVPARRTIGRWRDWLAERSLVFRFHLNSRFAELGRLADDADYWCQVFDTMGLTGAMAWVDREISVPS